MKLLCFSCHQIIFVHLKGVSFGGHHIVIISDGDMVATICQSTFLCMYCDLVVAKLY
jgi:hypothetical protein